jgi:phosphohistidine phosphatase SixA
LQKLPVANETYAIILRHGDADDGVDFSVNTGPANWWKSCERNHARQLNTRGKARSVELGQVFKDLKFPITRVISSEFCRSVKTAELMNIGPTILKDARINHPEHNITGKGLFNGMLSIMNEQPADNKMTLMVTHHPINETGSKGYPTFPLVSPFTWTGAYIVRVSANKAITYQGAVSFAMFKYWRDSKPK